MNNPGAWAALNKGCSKLLLASLGFDEKFVLRALGDHKPCKLVAVALDTGSDAWTRVEKAFTQLQLFSTSLGAQAELVRVPYRGESLPMLIWVLKKVLSKKLRGYNEVVAVLTGGPRLLVIALYTALMGLRQQGDIGNILLRIEGEGFNALVEEPLENLENVELDELSRELLKILINRSEEGLELGPGEAARLLGVPKSTAYKKLRQLAAQGLAEYNPASGRYRATRKAYVNV